MQFSISSSIAILQIFFTATATTALPADAEVASSSSTQQDDAGTTTCFPTMWPSASDVSSSTSVSTILIDRSPTPTPSPMPGSLKALPLCCCCVGTPISVLNQPQPSDIHYLGTCSKAGVRDVCTDQYTGSSGFTLAGLEGQPAKIAGACSVVRCGAMMFVD